MKYGMYGPAIEYYNMSPTNDLINATEHQLFEHIYKYCNDNNLDIDATVKEINLKKVIFVSTNRDCIKYQCFKPNNDDNIYYLYPPISWTKRRRENEIE
jgi:hypothetical protein